MAADKSVQINVEGARELRKAIRTVQDDTLKDQLKAANKAAAEIVAKEAKSSTVPVQSGALKASIKALGSQTKGQVKVGGAKNRTKFYAGPIHFGHPGRGIKPQPFLYEAMSNEWKNVYAAYEKSMDKIVDQISTRKS